MDESRFASKRSSSRISKDEVRSRSEAFSIRKPQMQKSRSISATAFSNTVDEEPYSNFRRTPFGSILSKSNLLPLKRRKACSLSRLSKSGREIGIRLDWHSSPRPSGSKQISPNTKKALHFCRAFFSICVDEEPYSNFRRTPFGSLLSKPNFRPPKRRKPAH